MIQNGCLTLVQLTKWPLIVNELQDYNPFTEYIEVYPNDNWSLTIVDLSRMKVILPSGIASPFLT